jgi:hypothetical protein
MSDLPGIQEAGSRPALDFIQGILDNYAPEGGTFDVELPMGEVLKFRALTSHPEYVAFRREATEYAQQRLKGHAHPLCVPLLPKEIDSLVSVYTIKELSVEPKFDELQALRLLGAPLIVDLIISEIDKRRCKFIAEGRNPLEEAQKKSTTTPSSESGSGSPGTSTDDTPTS